MRNILIAALAALSLWGAALADEAPATEPSEQALAFVGQFSDNHLSGMLSAVGARQPTMVAASQLNGQLVAVVFDTEIDKAVAARGPEWQRNMAVAWTGLMTDEELASLMADGADSPHAEKYAGLRNTAGQQMQALSADLFREILGEVIANTMEELGADAPSQ